MKLPWNKKYLIISFHVVVTLAMLYALKYGIDFLAYITTNLGHILSTIKNGIAWILSKIIVIIIAFVFSYLLDPVVEFFQNRYDILNQKYFKHSKPTKKKHWFRRKVSDKPKEKDRLAGTIITYLIIFIVILVLSGLLITRISKGGSGNFIDNLITSITNSIVGFQEDISKFYYKIEHFFIKNNIFDEYISPQLNRYLKMLTSFIYDIGNNAISIITNIGSGIVNVVVGLVVCFYFLKDKTSIKQKFEEVSIAFLPKKFYEFIKNALGDIHAVFSGYIRGTLLDASIMAILISCVLSLIGVKFAIIIGFVAGFSNIIPYFGALMGFILAIVVSLISGEPMKALYSTIAMFALQQIDTIFIAPKVIGESVELSPVLVIIALSVAGNLFGIWGMIFAVPVFATIKLFASRIYKRQKMKKESKFLKNI